MSEEQFYLIWPLIVWLVRDRVRLIMVASTLSVLALGLRIAMVLAGRFEAWMVHQLPFRMDALLLGAILALLLRGESADRWQRSCKWVFLFATAVAITIFVASPEAGSPWLLTIGFSMIALASSGLIGVALRPGSRAFRLFHLRPLRVLGKYSYGFYVYHVLWTDAWGGVVAFLRDRFHSSVLANGISSTVCFVVTFAVAYLSYNLVEVRFLRFKKDFEYDSEVRERRTALAAMLQV